MGFLDRISESISETGQEIKRKADQSSAKSQMHSDIKKKEKEMEALVYQIGFQMVSNEPSICEEKCPDLYKQLIETREAAKAIRNQLSLAELEIICPGCGRTVKGVSKFCTFCGTVLPEPDLNASADYELPNNNTVIKNQSGEICQNCGAPLKIGAAFCVNCGTPTVTSNNDDKPIEQAFTEKRVCKNCGAELIDGDAFCFNCGSPI